MFYRTIEEKGKYLKKIKISLKINLRKLSENKNNGEKL